MKFGKEMGYDISPCQMGHDAVDEKLKRNNKIQASFTLECTVLEIVERIKYMYIGVTIKNDLKENIHIIDICTKVNRTLGFLGRNAKAAYKELLHPILEYGSSVLEHYTLYN